MLLPKLYSCFEAYQRSVYLLQDGVLLKPLHSEGWMASIRFFRPVKEHCLIVLKDLTVAHPESNQPRSYIVNSLKIGCLDGARLDAGIVDREVLVSYIPPIKFLQYYI